MIRARSIFRIPKALFATLAALALAGCGGGGGGGSSGGGGGGTPPPVAVASVVFPASDAIAIQATQRTFQVTVKGDDGSTLTDRAIAWESSNTSIGTVAGNGQSGVFDALQIGSTNVTATVEGKSASVKVEVKAAPADLAAFKALFPFQDTAAAPFVAASEINDAYNAQQREHLIKAWNHFASFYPVTPGTHTELYYTWDPALLAYARTHFAECNSAVANLPGRQLLTCSELSNLSWIVSPNIATDGSVGPDHATALASVAQSFMDKIPTVETYQWPWLWEGLSYAFKSGNFDAADNYTMGALADPEATVFRSALSGGTLLSLDNLVALNRTRTPAGSGTWYVQPSIDTGTAQSAMLMSYLYRNHQPVIKNLFAAINAGTVTTSQQAFDFLLDPVTGIGMTTVGEIDAAYKAYGATP